MFSLSRIVQFFTGPVAPAVDPIKKQLEDIAQNPSRTPQKELIDHIFMWFNASGDPLYKIQLSNAVKQQVIEAAYSYIDGNGEPDLRNFSLEGLSISEMVMLYRIFESYQKQETAIGRKVILVHLSLIEQKLKELSKNPDTKKQILDAIREAEDGNANVLKFRIFSIPETSVPVTDDPSKEPTVISTREDLLTTIFGLLGPSDQGTAKKVCKYWYLLMNNEFFNKTNMKKLQAASFFTSTRISRLLSIPGMPTQVKVAVAYGEFTKGLKAHNIQRSVETPLLLSFESINEKDKVMQDKALIKFCSIMPPEVKQTLPHYLLTPYYGSQANTIRILADELRNSLANSEAVRNLQVLNYEPAPYSPFWYGARPDPLSTLPPEIKFFTSLTSLALAGNSLTELPVEITTLVNLERLGLSNNRLVSLPEGFGKLVNLGYLFLANNDLSSLPSDCGNLENLRVIELKNNNITSLPEDFFRLRKIVHIDLSHNRLTSLPEGITTALENSEVNPWNIFDFSCNQLSSLPKDFKEIGNNTRYIALRDNAFSPEYKASFKKAKKILF